MIEENLRMRVLPSVVLFCLCVGAFADLEDRLKHFEMIHPESVNHRITKRDIGVPEERKVDYNAFGRHFGLVLRRTTSVLAPDFRVVAVNGIEERVVDIVPNIFHGYLEGEYGSSSVSAYLEDDSTLSASISTRSGVYVVEPSWRHFPNGTNSTMITYKASDLDMEKDLGHHYCGYIRANSSDDEASRHDDELQNNEELVLNNHTSARAKRQASSCVTNERTVCPLLLVADYRFYKSMNSHSLSKTTGYLIGQIDRIHGIYKNEAFGNCGSGLGFEIKEIRIHEVATPTTGNTLHFNMERTNWDTTQLLEVFSTNPSFENFCLAHLFTHTAFDNGVLGLAYIGSPRSYSVGGICSPSYTKAGTKMYLNTGWSSSLNKYSRKLLTLEAQLVTAHEFGHNWGSEHDPDTSECSPSESTGGKYIMFTYSVSGIDSNNKIFSPCSRRAIGTVLRAKADTCFAKKTGGFCGNSNVEPGEECDEGAGSSLQCCTNKCKLKENAKCSDVNAECCDNCTYSLPTKVCYSQQDALCQKEVKCSGLSAVCPDAEPKADGSPCLERGKCVGGSCKFFCEVFNKTSCRCDEVETSCKWCCKDNTTSECRPFTGDSTDVSSFPLPNGIPCVQGFCDNGVCQKQVHDMVQRLWDIIENITVDKLVRFMRANIVGTVILLSLVIWIPGSCVVAYVDRKRAREYKESRDWLDLNNTQLTRKEDKDLHIQKSNDIHTRHGHFKQ